MLEYKYQLLLHTRSIRAVRYYGATCCAILRCNVLCDTTVNKLFSTQQFGFIKGRCTVLQLLNVIDSWTKALDRGESVDVLYLDFTKAFDTVPHKRLIGKLKSYGIEYYTLRWTQAFLSDRGQQVNVNGTNSE